METCREKKEASQRKRLAKRRPVPELCFVIALLVSLIAEAQDGDAGINQANTMIRDYFNTGVNLLYAVGGILGLIGAVKVYQKWSHGDHDTSKVAASWFGSCIFLVVVATLLRSFFGL
ncbi:MAG TPA: DUF4134 domain-containing protein [Puia sp.]|nr:DUF4134 domain-containing protein [Puia sp.]